MSDGHANTQTVIRVDSIRYVQRRWKLYGKNVMQFINRRSWVFSTGFITLVTDIVLLTLYIIEMHTGGRSLTLLYLLISVLLVYTLSIIQRYHHTRFRRRLLRDYVFISDLTLVLVTGIWLIVNTVAYIPYFVHIVVIPARFKRVSRVRKTVFGDTPFKENLFTLLVSVAVIILFFSCLFQILEMSFGERRFLTLFDSLYFIMVTTSTIGFGDFLPTNYMSRIMVIFMIVIIILIIPHMVSEALKSWQLQKAGGGSYKSFPAIKFVVIIGRFETLHKTFDIINSFLHTEWNDSPIDLILCSDEPINPIVKSLITQSVFHQRISYILGEATDEQDMKRLVINKADAVFILSHGSIGITDESAVRQDENNTLRLWTIRNFCKRVPVYIFNNLTDTERYQKNMANAIVSLDTWKQCILGLNIMYPGTATVILNLLYQNVSEMSDESHAVLNDPLSLYNESIGNEFYNSVLDESFVGVSFAEACLYMYTNHNVILLGIHTTDERHVISPKQSFTISRGDKGIFISQNRSKLAGITLDTSRFNDPEYSTLRNIVVEPISSETGGHSLSEYKQVDITDRAQLRAVAQLDNTNIITQSCSDAMSAQVLFIDSHHAILGNLKNHILIFSGTGCVDRIVTMLQTYADYSTRKIIIICESKPIKTVSDIISKFSNVHVLLGDPRDASLLSRLSISKAKRIAVLHLHDEDAPSIMLFHLISCMLHEDITNVNKPFCFVELIKRDHIRFFSKGSLLCGATGRMTPIESRLADDDNENDDETDYEENEYLPRFIAPRWKRFKQGVKSHSKRDPYLSFPLYASGQIIVTSLINTILFQTYHNSIVLDTVKYLIGMTCEHHLHWQSSQRSSVTRFERVFADNLQRGLVTIGFYRFNENSGNIVVTNPQPHEPIYSSDKMFVI